MPLQKRALHVALTVSEHKQLRINTVFRWFLLGVEKNLRNINYDKMEHHAVKTRCAPICGVVIDVVCCCDKKLAKYVEKKTDLPLTRAR